MTSTGNKVRIYDLARELKQESKRIIEDARREGIDVSVPSNTVPKEVAERIRNKYFPKKEVTVPRAVRVVKKAHRPAEHEEGAPAEAHPDEPPGAVAANPDAADTYEHAPAHAPAPAPG
ncbi:MAG TPA: translation initiation factor IF-2 N-terminal domain-containing protein, partial [Pyrinomonadaceae bacterium]|nr:translation initiation factor IF-2 N-terminal domain-containing protein [Pyrinomonadaceae bacterium]